MIAVWSTGVTKQVLTSSWTDGWHDQRCPCGLIGVCRDPLAQVTAAQMSLWLWGIVLTQHAVISALSLGDFWYARLWILTEVTDSFACLTIRRCLHTQLGLCNRNMLCNLRVVHDPAKGREDSWEIIDTYSLYHRWTLFIGEELFHWIHWGNIFRRTIYLVAINAVNLGLQLQLI